MFFATENGQKRPLNEIEVKKLTYWRIFTFWVMLIGYIGYYLVRGNLSAAFPLLGEAFSYSNQQLGMIGAYAEIAYAAGKFINGPIADRMSGKIMFLGGMLGAVLFNAWFGFSTSLTAFILIACGSRYFLSMGWGGLTKVIGNWYPQEKNGRIMGFISINFQFGGVLATLFAGWLVSQGSKWEDLFFYPSLITSALFLWSLFASKNSPDEVIPNTNFSHSQTGKKQLLDFGSEGKIPTKVILKKLFSMSFFWKLLLYSFVCHMVRSVFMVWTPKFLVDIGMGTTSAIITSTVFPFLGCLGTIFIGWYTDTKVKNGDRAQIMWIMLSVCTVALAGIGYLSGMEVKSFPLIIILLGISGFTLLGPYSMSAGALTLDLVGAQAAGTCTGMLDGVGYIGGALATWGVGVIADHYGWSQVYLAISVCAAVTTFSAFLMSQHMRKANKQQPVTR